MSLCMFYSARDKGRIHGSLTVVVLILFLVFLVSDTENETKRNEMNF